MTAGWGGRWWEANVQIRALRNWVEGAQPGCAELQVGTLEGDTPGTGASWEKGDMVFSWPWGRLWNVLGEFL